MSDLYLFIEEGKARPVAYKVFPLAEAQQAQELSETGHGVAGLPDSDCDVIKGQLAWWASARSR